jgi:hypothetical protein
MSESEFPCPPDPEKNACGGYYCSEEHGHIDCQKENLQIHMDCQPGLQMDGVTWEQLPNHGQPCWRATQKIGSIFGSEVDGELHGIGATKDVALERLAEERRQLHESLWA